MGTHPPPSPRRLHRLVEELEEVGLVLDGSEPWHEVAVVEVDYALRPAVHERRVPTYGAIVAPTTDPAVWEDATDLRIARRAVGGTRTSAARTFADGRASWLLRPGGVGGGPPGPVGAGRGIDAADDEWVVFDRPASSERDLVVLSEAMGAVVVQRHAAGIVRVVGDFGVLRWNGMTWRHEPLVTSWLDVVEACTLPSHRPVIETLLEFAVHDLGSRGIGATLVHGPDLERTALFDHRLPTPPPLQVGRASDLAPLRHALAQVDGAALFATDGTLRHIGVRLVPSARAEAEVDGFRGTRHTSARRYSADDPGATVVVVSEDGPVTVMRAGKVRGASAAP